MEHAANYPQESAFTWLNGTISIIQSYIILFVGDIGHKRHDMWLQGQHAMLVCCSDACLTLWLCVCAGESDVALCEELDLSVREPGCRSGGTDEALYSSMASLAS